MENAIIASYDSYNSRRYSLPWVCEMTVDGKYNFDKRAGTYTGDAGEGGDLIVFEPTEGTVYAYGIKDYRGNGTQKAYAVWDGSAFAECDKLGRIRK